MQSWKMNLKDWTIWNKIIRNNIHYKCKGIWDQAKKKSNKKKLQLKLRRRVTYVKINLRRKYETLECAVCKEEEESQMQCNVKK